VTLSTWLALFAATWAISLSPGVGAVAAMSAGLRCGFSRGYWNTIGLVLGILAQLVVVGIGLGALLSASELAFAAVKWLGVAYLVYLGWRQWRTDAAPVTAHAIAPQREPIRQLVARGFLINAMNPKGTVFLLAVVPQFIDPAQTLWSQYVIIGGTMASVDLIAMGLYTALAAHLLRYLKQAHHVRWLNRCFGSLFVLAAVWLATFRRV